MDGETAGTVILEGALVALFPNHHPVYQQNEKSRGPCGWVLGDGKGATRPGGELPG